MQLTYNSMVYATGHILFKNLSLTATCITKDHISDNL